VTTTTKLRSPVINLAGVTGAELTFAEALDLEGGDTAVVNIIDDTTDAIVAGGAAVYTADDSAEPGAAGWNPVAAIDLTPFVGQAIRVEWFLTGGTTEYLGWYIDDVKITETGITGTEITLKNLSEATETVISMTDPQVSISGDTLTIDPASDLDFEDDYAVQIGANAITDLSGNPFAGNGDDLTWNFTTRVMPTVINILNAGFENVSNAATNGNWHDMDDWTQEESGPQVYVDDNGTGWVPEPSRTLYFGPGAVHQNLNHNWSPSNVFTLGLIAMNPRWSDSNNTFKVQLRQASDDTVLWDSGDQNVGGTVTTTAPATYTGTGHVFSWSIDASTFTAGVEGEQINIRIAHVSGGPVYADDISLDFTGGGGTPTPYANWASSKGVTLGPDGDDDGGGTSNIAEFYYFDGDPQVVEGHGSPLTGATKTGANTFVFTHQAANPRDDVTATYLWSIDLVNWYLADGTDSDGTYTVNAVAVGDTATPLENITVTATVAGGTPATLFLNQTLSTP